jgi:hypothetical protein
LSPQEAAYYQSLIGILRWIVELGRVDICLEVSMMSSHLVLPREGHLEQVFLIFAHLKKYHKNVETILRNEMGKYFALKQETNGTPKDTPWRKSPKGSTGEWGRCMGIQLITIFASSSKNVEDWLAKEENKKRWKQPRKAKTPLCTSYRPELDVTPKLSPQEAAYYQSLVGIL